MSRNRNIIKEDVRTKINEFLHTTELDLENSFVEELDELSKENLRLKEQYTACENENFDLTQEIEKLEEIVIHCEGINDEYKVKLFKYCVMKKYTLEELEKIFKVSGLDYI